MPADQEPQKPVKTQKCPQCQKVVPVSMLRSYLIVMPPPNPQDSRACKSCALCVQRLTNSGITFSGDSLPTDKDRAELTAYLDVARIRRRKQRAAMIKGGAPT